MTWYDKNTIPQWKVLIGKPYQIQTLLFHKDIFINPPNKELFVITEEQVKQYMLTHGPAIIQDCLQLCLKNPGEADYDRKFSLPTKAIELMSNQHFFQSLGWNQQLVNQYIHLLFHNYLSIDPNINNINIYHGYFQNLLMRPFQFIKNKADIIAAIEKEQLQNKVLQKLFKFTHKYSIVASIQMLLTFDLCDPNLIINAQIKQTLITNAFAIVQCFARGQNIQEQKVQHCLQLLKNYLQKNVQFIVIASQSGIMLTAQDKQASLSAKDKKILDFMAIYTLYQKNHNMLMSIILNKSQNCLKVVTMELFRINQIFLMRIKRPDIKSDWCIHQNQALIAYFISSKITICFPVFLEWLNILCLEVGFSAELIETLIRHKVIQRLLLTLGQNRGNSIIVVRIFTFLKTLFDNIDRQIVLSIEKHKNININFIKFHLFNYFFSNVTTIQNLIKSFSSYLQCLFTNCILFYKILYNGCNNLIDIFDSPCYQHFQICSTSKLQLQTVIQFYDRQACFKLYNFQISKSLGTFYNDQLFANQKPTQYAVIQPLVMRSNISSKLITNVSQESYSSTQMNAIVMPIIVENSQSAADSIVQEQVNSSSNLIEIKFDSNPVLKAISPKIQKVMQKVEHKIQSQQNIQVKSDVNNGEQSDGNFQSYMKKKLMQEAHNIQEERRSKSRTPTKIKNDIKKAKNKWTTEQPNSQSNQNIKRGPFSSEIVERNAKSTSPTVKNIKIDLNLQKIKLIRLSKNKTHRKNKQRPLQQIRDSRLMEWLNCRKMLR